MRKLIIALLVVMLSIGLSGVAFAGEQSQIIEGDVSDSLAISNPADIDKTTGWTDGTGSTDALDVGSGSGVNTADPTFIVQSNAPFHVTIKADDTSSEESGSSGHMNRYTGSNYSTAADCELSLDHALQFEYSSISDLDSVYTPSIASQQTALANLTSSNQTILYVTNECTSEAGFQITILFDQEVGYDDPNLPTAYSWRLVNTYTASQDLP